MLYRRPTMALFGDVYNVRGPTPSTVIPTTGRVRGELVMAALLSPFMVTNLRASADPHLYAMDASPWLGAVCRTWVGEPAARKMFLRKEAKGGYSRLEDGARAILVAHGCLPDELDSGEFFDENVLWQGVSQKQKGNVFDVLEQGGGATEAEGGGACGSSLSQAAALRGLRVGPVVDPHRYREWNLLDNHI